MSNEQLALERLHRARCIVTTVAKSAVDSEVAGALLAAVDLIMQGMAEFDPCPPELLETVTG